MPPASSALASLLQELFQGRRDAYALQQEDGSYRTVRKELTLELLEKHCRGEETLGLYLLTSKGVWVGVIDIDFKGPQAQSMIRKAGDLSASVGTPLLVESSGRKGYHMWLLCQGPTDAGLVQYYLLRLLQIVGEGQRPHGVEIFPKQSGGVALGNPIKLPFGIHKVTSKRTAFLDIKTWTAYEDWGLEALKTLERATEESLKRSLALLSPKKDAQEAPKEEDEKKPLHKGLLLCYPKMEQGVPQGSRDEVMFRLAVHYWDQGYTEEQAVEKLLAVNAKNNPPLDEKVLGQKASQAFTGRYGFGCTGLIIEPFCKHNCPIYPKRFKAGFGQDLPQWSSGLQEGEVDEKDLPHHLTIIKTQPRYYEAGVQNYRLILTGTELLSLRGFKKRVMDELDFIPKIPWKQAKWEGHVDELLRKAQLEEAPETTSFTRQMIELLYEWLQSIPPADLYEEALEGRPVSRNGRWFFRGQDIAMQMKNRYHVIIGTNRLWAELVREVGGGSQQVSVGERKVDLWWVPRKAVEADLDLEGDLNLEDA